jgi:hypothetical protein
MQSQSVCEALSALECSALNMLVMSTSTAILLSNHPVRLQANGSRGEAYTFYVRAVAVELVLKQPLMCCPNFHSVWYSVFMYSVSSSALLSRVRRHAYAGVSVIMLSAHGIVHSA